VEEKLKETVNAVAPQIPPPRSSSRKGEASRES
jgi:hypothetical protein